MNKRFCDRWDNVESLGEGGQGWTYIVTDSTNEHPGKLVLKRLKNVNRQRRFQQEIETVRQLDRAGIQRILWSSPDEAIYVSPFYPGGNLQQLVDRGEFRGDPVAALQVFADICRAVASFHEEAVVHRDLKPANIVFDDSGTPVIIDFGICFTGDDSGRLTETLEQVGSRWYMPPEFEAGRAEGVSTAADCYSLGKVLYYMLAEKPLPREKYQEKGFDLAQVTGDYQLGYVTSIILAATLCEDPEDRKSAFALGLEADRVARLIAEHYYPGQEGSKCRFCGEGAYERLARVGFPMRNKHMKGEFRFEALRCRTCHHFVMFGPSDPDIK